jgi:hypothetical protein
LAQFTPYTSPKLKKKAAPQAELNEVITWLTGYTEKQIHQLIADKVTFETFFKQAKVNPNATLITGLICGYRVEEITNKLTQQTRYLDKLVDELAKGKSMEKILRVAILK